MVGKANILTRMKSEELERLAFFKGLRPVDMKLLAPFFAPQCYPSGITVFEQGDKADYLYLVSKGEVVIRYKPDDGPVMTVTRVQPGGIFGWSAAMGNPAYTSAAMCVTDSEVVRIRGTDLRTLCAEYPEVGRIILDRLAAVIAERKQSQQSQVTSMLANGIRQQGIGRGEENDGSIQD
jgi:CRP/FNR family cyclic AMP-dependent transcriptional regulator